MCGIQFLCSAWCELKDLILASFGSAWLIMHAEWTKSPLPLFFLGVEIKGEPDVSLRATSEEHFSTGQNR